MKKLLTLFYLAISLGSCAQKESKKETVMNQENIQKVTNIYKTIKKYEQNPSYTLHLTASNFSFEILINDFPVQTSFDPGIFSGSMPINEALLKSGKQKLTIRMTPPVDKQYKMEKVIDLDKAELKLNINYGDYTKQKVEDFKEALQYELPKKSEKLPYYEVNLEFDVSKLPYENDVNGWKNSVDLSKEDKDVLLKEAEDFYKAIIKLYESKDVNKLAQNYYKRQVEMAQSNYQNKPQDSQVIIDEWIKDVNDKKPFVFKDYVLQFYGNGKIIKLAKTDKYYLNLSALFKEDKDGNFQEYIMFLHRPKPGAALEVIR